MNEGRRDSTGTDSRSPPCRYMLCEEAAPFRSSTHTLLYRTENVKGYHCFLTQKTNTSEEE